MNDSVVQNSHRMTFDSLDLSGLFGFFGDGIALIIFIAVYLFYGFCQYRLSTKLNVPYSWMAWIPVLGFFQLLTIAQVSLWWLVTLFIPFVNFVTGFIVSILIAHGLSSRTGHDGWWTAGLIFFYPIMFPITALTYEPSKSGEAQNTPPTPPSPIPNTSTRSSISNDLEELLNSLDITGITSVQFHINGGKTFQINLDSVKRIALFIEKKAGKNTFGAGELLEEKEFFLTNYRSKLSESDYQMLVGYLSEWVEKGGSFDIVRGG